jgi:hypothetical protein
MLAGAVGLTGLAYYWGYTDMEKRHMNDGVLTLHFSILKASDVCMCSQAQEIKGI